MKWIKEYFLICIFLCGTSLISEASDQHQQLFHDADSIYVAGAFQDAAIEYERIIFFSKEREIVRQARIKKAACYKQMLQFPKAIDCLGKVNLFGLDDASIWFVKTEMAFCYFLNAEPQKALMQITQAKYRVKSDSLKSLTLPLEAYCHNENKDWEKAKLACLNYIDQIALTPQERTGAKKQIEFFYSKKQLPKLKSPEKAENLSRFVPGLGQVYCGKIGEGSFNFLLNLSFLALGAHQIYHKFYFTGYTAGFGIFHKTYYGNLARVKHLAHSTNETRHGNFKAKIMEFLLGLDPIQELAEKEN